MAKNEEQTKDETTTCPVQQFQENEDEEPFITHAIVTKAGDIFYVYRSLELEAQLPNGDIGILLAIDALDFPEEGDRSIITIEKGNVDYTQEYYDKDYWESLMRAAYCSNCEQLNNNQHPPGLYG